MEIVLGETPRGFKSRILRQEISLISSRERRSLESKRAQRPRPGADVGVHRSIELAQTLPAAGLVDEYRPGFTCS